MPINTCAHELRAWGIDLRALIRTRPFMFSEVGLGGGKDFRCEAAPGWDQVLMVCACVTSVRRWAARRGRGRRWV